MDAAQSVTNWVQGFNDELTKTLARIQTEIPQPAGGYARAENLRSLRVLCKMIEGARNRYDEFAFGIKGGQLNDVDERQLCFTSTPREYRDTLTRLVESVTTAFVMFSGGHIPENLDENINFYTEWYVMIL